VGTGAFGEFCLAAFAEMPDIRIIAVADVDMERAQRIAAVYGVRAYATLDALLGDPTVEIVSLNTPPAFHAEQGLAVLNAGKHLFCEKPLALTADDAKCLSDTAQMKKLRLTVNYVMRHNSFWMAAASLAQSGVLGKLRHMDLTNHAAGLSLPDRHWFWNKALSGGIWIEHGVHFFDAFAWVSGKTGKVISASAYQRHDGATDRVEALVSYGDVAAHFYHAFDQSAQTEQTTVNLAFTHGYVRLNEWIPTSLEVLTSVNRALWQDLLPGRLDSTVLSDGRIHARACASQGKSVLYRHSIQQGMQNLSQAVHDSDRELIVSGEHGLASLKLAIAAESTGNKPEASIH
jgi:predicted dehydrogenase